MRIIVIGPPGAGKGTQANKLAAKMAVPHVSTRQLLRESVSMGTKPGVATKHYVEAGDPVPAGVTNALVADRLSQPDCRSRGFILDGYPRSPDQTEALTRTLTANDASIDAVLHFQVCKGELLKRLRQRARADDTDDVVEHRLQVYREQSAPLLDHYRNELITVDGIGSINDVFARALRALGL